ncbi:tellurite resistance protein TerB [Deinobacterium chartae]|uniref:Tellurite resistance protein TerB n=1 Tax=Deinobacterium chartae TaxID=521158 RepID=A0A841HWP6_9DEIO|nr:tellurite resistance TerB family protein [Deinobacterium chartae]MBB6097346.1 tellurite resistance protein TerB [Deinobacterium chartae]
MSLWNNLKQSVSQLSGSLQTSVAKFRNQDFAHASMAMCALIAAADGNIDPQERSRTASLIMSNDALRVFPADELRQKFDLYCDKLVKDYDFGRIEAIQAVSKLRSKPDQARAVLQVGIVIGGADGHFDERERAVVREVCHAVGINPAEFSL